MQIDVPNRWYLFTYGVEIPVRWEGKEIDESSVSPDERRLVTELLNKYWTHLEQEFYKQGSYDFSRFWCTLVGMSIIYGGPGKAHAFLLPKSEENLRFLVEKKAELARPRDACKSMFPAEFKAVRDAFDLLHPIGHMLIMEASIVYLSGQEEEMMREAAEYFRDIRDDEYLRIIAAKMYGWLKEDVDLNVGKSYLEYIHLRDELAFKARFAKYGEILEHIEKGNRAEAIRKLRAMRRGDWYHVEPGISREAERDDPDRWYVITGYLKTRGEEPIRVGCQDTPNIGEWSDAGTLKEERDRVLKALNLAEPWKDLEGILVSLLPPELSVGAWFETATVAGGSIIGPNRLGCHMNDFWCFGTRFECSQGEVSILPSFPRGGPANIKGPYIIPRRKGVLQMLSERRLSLKEMVRAKAHERGLDALDIKPMVLIFEVKSTWLGQPDDKETAKIREWFSRARNVGVRRIARGVKKNAIKPFLPDEDFIRYLGDALEWTADVFPWIESQRRMIKEAMEKKDQVQAEGLSVELRDKVEVIKSILSVVELHERVYPRWADKVSGGFAEQVGEVINKAKRVVAEEDASRIRLHEEKLAELKRRGVEVRIRIEANSAKDSYERHHGMTIDRSLQDGFWIYQEDAVIGTGATPFTHEETVVLLPGSHYLIYGNSGGWGDFIWDAKVYINDKLVGQGQVSKPPIWPYDPQFLRVTFTIPKQKQEP